MLPATQDQPAYILHRRPFRETSVIVDLLTRDFGRVGGVVRGAKGGKRPRYSLEPFGQVAVAWRGRGQLVTVLRSESTAPGHFTGDALFAGLYLNELLVKTLEPEEPVAALFHRYGLTLARLGAGDALESTLRSFERRLLEELGYGLAFDVDIRSGAPIESDKTYSVVDGQGFRELARTGPRETNGDLDQPVAVGELTLTGAEITAISNDDLARSQVRHAAKLIYRRALQAQLRGKTLNTRQLFTARRAIKHADA